MSSGRGRCSHNRASGASGTRRTLDLAAELKKQEPVTSANTPLKISWISDAAATARSLAPAAHGAGLLVPPSAGPPPLLAAAPPPLPGARVAAAPLSPSPSPSQPSGVGVCSCPGKRVAKPRARAGHEEVSAFSEAASPPIERDLLADLLHFREDLGLTLIVCLLNEAELRTIGVDSKRYPEVAAEAGLELICFPIIEGAGAGGDVEEVHEKVLLPLQAAVGRGGRCALHCRGGVGRAGMLAACFLLLTGEASTSKQAISTVRRRRCKQAVETRRQEDFVKSYSAFLRGSAKPKPGAAAAAEEAAGAAGAAGRAPGEGQGRVRLVILNAPGEKCGPAVAQVEGEAAEQTHFVRGSSMRGGAASKAAWRALQPGDVVSIKFCSFAGRKIGSDAVVESSTALRFS